MLSTIEFYVVLLRFKNDITAFCGACSNLAGRGSMHLQHFLLKYMHISSLKNMRNESINIIWKKMKTYRCFQICSLRGYIYSDVYAAIVV